MANARIQYTSQDIWISAIHAWENLGGLALATLIGALCASGVISRENWPLAVGATALIGARGLWFYRTFGLEWDKESRVMRGMEFSVLPIVATCLLLLVTGRADSPFYPLLYLALVALGAFLEGNLSVAGIVTAVVFELFSTSLFRGTFSLQSSHIFHFGYILIFGFFPYLFLKFDDNLRNREIRERFSAWVEEFRNEARNFRNSARDSAEIPLHERDREQDVSGLVAFKEALDDQLKATQKSLEAHTCVMLWYDAQKDVFVPLRSVSPSPRVQKDPFPARYARVVQAAIERNIPLRVHCEEWTEKRLGYYRRREYVKHLLIVPVGGKAKKIGVLCIDRKRNFEFDEMDVDIANLAARQIHRLLKNEDLVRDLDQSREEQRHLLEISRSLAQTRNAQEVFDLTFSCCHKVAPFDSAAYVEWNPQNASYRIVYSYPQDCGLKDICFAGKNNLVDLVVRQQKTLFHSHFSKLEKIPTVFTPNERLHDVHSLLIVPLAAKGTVQGTLVFLSSRPGFFNKILARVYEVAANQAALSLENARMFERIEKMALTDPLTGLYNRRFCQQRLDEMLIRADRYQYSMGVVMCDIDHFKNINDTYGHQVGDQVLCTISALFKKKLRRSDLVARWGGEEFLIVLDKTDRKETFEKVEMLRRSIAGLELSCDEGNFKVTISAGVACYPADERHREKLIEMADKALYYSKEHGRNQTSQYDEIHQKSRKS